MTDFDNQKPDDIIKIIQERVKAFADSHPDDAVLHGSGWERIWFEGRLGGIKRLLTRKDIDAVVPDRPVTLDSDCGHCCLLNTKALELAGLMGSTSDPLGEMIQREPDGTPTGMIYETSAIIDVCGRIPGLNIPMPSTGRRCSIHRISLLPAVLPIYATVSEPTARTVC